MEDAAEDRKKWVLELFDRDRVKCAVVGCENLGHVSNRVEELFAFSFSMNRVQFFLCDTHMEELIR